MSRKRTPKQPPATPAPAPKPTALAAWGRPEELAANRKGELLAAQRQRILRISIFDPWLRLLFGGFLAIFAASQRLESWQFWLPAILAIFPLISAINGLFARRRLASAHVEAIEATFDDVRPHRSDAVAATLHRERLFMFLLNYDSAGALPRPNTRYRCYVVFQVIRPGIVLTMEELPEPTPSPASAD